MKAWVIGAGFSRALGGPLLADLLSRAALERLRQAYPGTWVCAQETLAVAELYHEGKAQKLWPDAEGFLSELTDIESGKAGSRLMELWANIAKTAEIDTIRWDGSGEDGPLRFGYDHLRGHAPAMVAAQCMHFVTRSERNPEIWLPYERWVRSLGADDVVISFNYDAVVETAFKRVDREIMCPNPRYGVAESLPKRGCTLLKLHGSVTFRNTKQEGVEDSIENLVDNVPCIALPGPEKADLADTEFGPLWGLAADALRKAEQIAVIGYSIPASDELAKAWLLDCLGARGGDVDVEFVLGLAAPDAVRLEDMLSIAGVRARRLNLWATDYLTACGIGQGWDPAKVS